MLTALVFGQIDYCDSSYNDCEALVAVEGKANSVINIPINAKAVNFVGDDCDKSGCVQYNIAGLEYVGNVGFEISVHSLYKASYSSEVKVKLADGISGGDC